MKPSSRFKWHRFALIPLLMILGIMCSPAFGDDTPAEGDQTPLQLGRVTILGPATCPANATQGAACTNVSVSCPSVPDLTAILSEAIPTVTAKGTIILVNGGGGTAFFNSGFANTYLNDGFRVVQLAWTTDWEDANGAGLVKASCRKQPSSGMLFIPCRAQITKLVSVLKVRAAEAPRSPMLSRNTSSSDYFDYVVIGAGPGVARMDYGCDKALYTGPPLKLCSAADQLLPIPFFRRSKWTPGKIRPRALSSAAASDINRWTADSDRYSRRQLHVSQNRDELVFLRNSSGEQQHRARVSS